MNLVQLRARVDAGEIDTVLLALCDMQGRLQGKRLSARHFVDEVAEEGAEGCNYLLAVDVEMNTVGGYAMSSWDRGYGDFELIPDLETLRLIPWLEGTALVLCDLRWAGGDDVVASPRQILKRQLQRLAERGWSANASTELEFMLFSETYETAHAKRYADLVPANLYNLDYSLLATARVEPLIRRIRNGMGGAGLVVENSKGECNFGQHEINFRYADALRTADDHVIYRNGAKEIAAQEGMAISFMAKFDEREGSSCHIHFSLSDESDPTHPMVFASDSGVFESFLAGQLACLRELTLLLGAEHQLLQALRRWVVRADDDRLGPRQPHLRAARGRARSALRFENRAGGSDLNPYLALSALAAAGLHGVQQGLELEPAYEGNAYEATDKPRLPTTLREARDLFDVSRVARDAFGDEVVDHYVHAADVELSAFEAAVTDWERARGFERL